MVKPLKIICPIAGVGKRLQPFTYSKPKAFLKLAGKTIIDHAMDMLKETFPAGTEILFIVGYKKEMIVKHITKRYGDHFILKFVDQEQRGVIDDIPVFPGLGHAIYLARSSGFLPADSDHGMFVFLSDRLPIDGFSGIHQAFHDQDFDGVINTSVVDHPEHYGVVKVNEQRAITKLVEKPREFISNIAISGIYIFNARATNVILDFLAGEVKKPIRDDQEYQFTPALQHAVSSGLAFTTYQMEHEILDIGRPRSFLLGNKFFLDSVTCTLDFYTIENTHVIQPSFIGKHVTIKNSIVGPYVSIGDNVEITNCIITNAVIGDGSSLVKVISSDSIVGEGCQLEDIIKDKMTVGDRSVISTRKNSDF